MRSAAYVRALPDHALLDRVIRGRAWIPLLGVLLVGIVAMQVEVLKLNAGIGRSLERGTALQSQNQLLRASVTRLSDDQRIERLAAAQGMIMPAPQEIKFLSTGAVTTERALSSVHAPDAPTFATRLAAVTAAAAAADAAQAAATSAGTGTAGTAAPTTASSTAGTVAAGTAGATVAPTGTTGTTGAATTTPTSTAGTPASTPTGTAGTAASTPIQTISGTPQSGTPATSGAGSSSGGVGATPSGG